MSEHIVNIRRNLKHLRKSYALDGQIVDIANHIDTILDELTTENAALKVEQAMDKAVMAANGALINGLNSDAKALTAELERLRGEPTEAMGNAGAAFLIAQRCVKTQYSEFGQAMLVYKAMREAREVENG